MANPQTVLPLPRARVPAAETPNPGGLLGLAVGVVVIAALYLGQQVLVPITLSVLLSFVLAPLVRTLRRIGLPKVPSVLLSVTVAFALILMLGALIGTQVAGLAENASSYQATIETKVASVQDFAASRADRVIADLSRVAGRNVGGPSPAPGAAGHARGGSRAMPVTIENGAPSPLALLHRFLGPVLAPFETFGIVIVVAVFVLLQQEDLRDRVIRLFGSSDLHRTTLAIDDAARRLSRYFLSQLAVNASFGVVVGIGLTIIGVPSPILWGVVGMLLRFVPYVGSFIAGLLPAMLAAAVEPGWAMALETVALFVVVEAIVGQAVEPMVYGHSTGLSPAAVIIVAIFWSWIWGPIGLILSTPITLCLVVLGRHVKRLEFLDVLLGDRPALTPIEGFYQRMLAGDTDEVLEQAEALLRARALSSYYDDVALKALQLAASDHARGTLPEERLSVIREAVAELVSDLDGHDDDDPPPSGRPDDGVAGLDRPERRVGQEQAPNGGAVRPEDRAPVWRGETPVLCVSGRGPLDEAAALMLAQLMRKHGIGARVIDHAGVSRAALPAIPRAGVAMVCVSYLEITGKQTHLRYLLRRLRGHFPDATFVIGLWPADDPLLADEDLRGMTGADLSVSSLREAVNAALDLSRGVQVEPKLPVVA